MIKKEIYFNENYKNVYLYIYKNYNKSMAQILLVEDELNIASFIERGLKEFGHIVSVVYDGNTGWEKMQKETFDLMILDIIIPKINGIEL